MWGMRVKETLATLALLCLAAFIGVVFWLRSEVPGQKPVRVAANIVSFATPAASEAALAQKDSEYDVTVRFADGQTTILSVPTWLTRNCRVGHTVLLAETLNRAGQKSWSMPPGACG